MPNTTTVISSLPSQSVDLPDDYWWDFETVTTSASSQSSQSVGLTRHTTRTSTLSTFATSTSTSSSTTEPLSTHSTTSSPTFTLPASLPSTSTLPSTAQPTKFPTGIVIGVSSAAFILLIALISLLAWKGKLGRLKLIRNPYVATMKKQAQDERVRRRERERAIERGWGVGNERESMIAAGSGDVPETVENERESMIVAGSGDVPETVGIAK